LLHCPAEKNSSKVYSQNSAVPWATLTLFTDQIDQVESKVYEISESLKEEVDVTSGMQHENYSNTSHIALR